jgi:hypothetical protein
MAKPRKKQDEDSRPVKATYYNGTGDRAKAVKRTAGVYAPEMMRNAFHHLQLGHFPKAMTCEVYDHKVLHGQLAFLLENGKWRLHTIFERNSKTGMKKVPA